MSEERGAYNPHHDDPARDGDGVERIGDILGRLIGERGWPPLPGTAPVNGNRPGGDDDPWHGDA